MELGSLEEYKEEMEHAIRILRATQGEEHPETLEAVHMMKSVLDSSHFDSSMLHSSAPPSSSGSEPHLRKRRRPRPELAEPSSYLWMFGSISVISAFAAASFYLSYKILKLKSR